MVSISVRFQDSVRLRVTVRVRVRLMFGFQLDPRFVFGLGFV